MPRVTCERCSRPQTVCYCHLIRPVANRWPVQILQHHKEAGHPLNTARIAALSLAHCAVLPCSDTSNDADLQHGVLAQGCQPILIYPSAASVPIDSLDLQPSNALLFIDASWRKSRRLYLQSPWLQGLPACHVRPASPSRYRLRKEPQPHCLSTLEAIVSVLEAVGDSSAESANSPASMLAVMDWMIARQLAAFDTDSAFQTKIDSGT